MVSDIAQLRQALEMGPWNRNEWMERIEDAARELLTIKEAGALIITPDEKTVDVVARAIARSSRQSWDDSARHVLDALRDAMPLPEP